MPFGVPKKFQSLPIAIVKAEYHRERGKTIWKIEGIKAKEEQ
jgi:hypothetical protein